MFERNASDPGLPMLDEGFLARLAGYIGPDVLAELAADGLIDLADRLNRLGELLEANDLDAVARVGHDLVGMAGNLGLARLSSAAAAMNRAARAGDVVPASACVAEVRQIGADAAAALRGHLDALTGGARRTS